MAGFLFNLAKMIKKISVLKEYINNSHLNSLLQLCDSLKMQNFILKWLI